MSNLVITFTMPEANAQELVDAACAVRGYDRNKLPEETRQQFTHRVFVNFGLDLMARARSSNASTAALTEFDGQRESLAASVVVQSTTG